MADVVIVGDGPGALSAALFLAKNQLEVVVVGRDETPMHKAMLFNYLGIPEITGSEFMELAREQASSFGARLLDADVDKLEHSDGTFAAITVDGERHEGRYLILAVGSRRQLADDLRLAKDDDGTVVVDREARTSVDGVYALGWTTKRHRTQAIISAGEGAAAALDILSTEKGQDFHDFDVVQQD